MFFLRFNLLVVFSSVLGCTMLVGCAAPRQSTVFSSAFDRARPVALSFERSPPEPKIAFLIPQNALPKKPSLETDDSLLRTSADIRTIVRPSPIFYLVSPDIDRERPPEVVFSQPQVNHGGSVSSDFGPGSVVDNAISLAPKPQTSRQPETSRTASQ